MTRRARDPEYEPLTTDDAEPPGYHDGVDDHDYDGQPHAAADDGFSWAEYAIFTLLGIAMLWAWNMFLAAAPYFSSRLAGSRLQSSFQSFILAVSTATNLLSMAWLSRRQRGASYPLRIRTALVLNTAVFALLAASTVFFTGVSPAAYLTFLLLSVLVSSWATGLVQNGSFAFAASFARAEYLQALMAGQAVAGILPPLTQVVGVLAFPPSAPPPGDDAPAAAVAAAQAAADAAQDAANSSAAFFYFFTAVAICVVTLLAFNPLARRHHHIVRHQQPQPTYPSPEAQTEAEVPLLRLLRKLRWPASAVFLVFAETMFFPVLTAKILSVAPDMSIPGQRPSLSSPAAFIPLAFFAWNLGDLSGRLSTMWPALGAVGSRYPRLTLLLAVARAAMVPLYLLCNVGGRGAAVDSDAFYFLLQVAFGFTNGWLGSNCMMAAPGFVDEAEREAAGGFMGLCLVAGLSFGSLLSFSASGL